MVTDKDLNYDDLASGLKEALENDQSVFDADRLQKYTGNSHESIYISEQMVITLNNVNTDCLTLWLLSGPELRELLKWPRPLPLEDERVRLLHEVHFYFITFSEF